MSTNKECKIKTELDVKLFVISNLILFLGMILPDILLYLYESINKVVSVFISGFLTIVANYCFLYSQKNKLIKIYRVKASEKMNLSAEVSTKVTKGSDKEKDEVKSN
jgi:hypothetical protein